MSKLEKLYYLQSGRCFYCNQAKKMEEMNLEHLVPQKNKDAFSGLNSIDNLVAVCIGANDAFGSMSFKEKMRIFIHRNEFIPCPSSTVTKNQEEVTAGPLNPVGIINDSDSYDDGENTELVSVGEDFDGSESDYDLSEPENTALVSVDANYEPSESVNIELGSESANNELESVDVSVVDENIVRWLNDKNNVRWVVDEIIKVFYTDRFFKQLKGGPFFLSKTHLVVVFPRILDILNEMNEYKDLKLPSSMDISKSGNIFFCHAEKIDLIDKSPSGKVQRTFRYSHNGSFQEHDGVGGNIFNTLRGLAIPISKLDKVKLKGMRRWHIRFYDSIEPEHDNLSDIQINELVKSYITKKTEHDNLSNIKINKRVKSNITKKPEHDNLSDIQINELVKSNINGTAFKSHIAVLDGEYSGVKLNRGWIRTFASAYKKIYILTSYPSVNTIIPKNCQLIMKMAGNSKSTNAEKIIRYVLKNIPKNDKMYIHLFSSNFSKIKSELKEYKILPFNLPIARSQRKIKLKKDEEKRKLKSGK